MYRGKRLSCRKTKNKAVVLVASLVLLFVLTVGGVLAYLVANTEPVENTFVPSNVTTTVTEDFDGESKKNVNAMNTGDIDVYIRIKLVTYRVNENGDRIGGTTEIPNFTLGKGWAKHTDGMYYYTAPVAPGEMPAVNLIGESGISLKKYNDADGGKQVIEVMAEAIQADGVDSNGKKAVIIAWGVDPESLN